MLGDSDLPEAAGGRNRVPSRRCRSLAIDTDSVALSVAGTKFPQAVPIEIMGLETA